MGAYLDRLNAQHDEILAGINAVVDRAADENRDVTDAEQAQVDRDRTRLSEVATAVERYTELETQGARVAELRRSLPVAPVTTRTTAEPEPEYDIAREFPSIGDYVLTVHRATALRDPEATARLERATAHQLLADNPGIVPRPILGPLVNLLDTSRPLINSISRKSLPAGSFDRPHITQHVAVGKQSAEKTLTESQKLLIGKMPVTAATYAGHLNISRQDVKWTSPGIMSIVFEDFAAIYAQVTEDDAATQFVASAGAPDGSISDWASGLVQAALFAASGHSMGTGAGPADTVWMSVDVWVNIGSIVNPNGSIAFPGSATSTSGSPVGLRQVVVPTFPAGTMIVGPSRYAEWYEDVDGLMQVGEPDVLGQLVGYAGFGAFLNVAPEAFTQITVPAAAP